MCKSNERHDANKKPKKYELKNVVHKICMWINLTHKLIHMFNVLLCAIVHLLELHKTFLILIATIGLHTLNLHWSD
jgi:hypothetical protein